ILAGKIQFRQRILVHAHRVFLRRLLGILVHGSDSTRRWSNRSADRLQRRKSVDATTYGVLVTQPTLCVVPSAGFVTLRSSTRASLVIAPPSADAAYASSARTDLRLTSRSSARICA